MRDEVFPVCAPALLSGDRPLRTPADLADHVLLQDGGLDWGVWLKAAGITDGIEPYRGPGFVDSTMSIQSAVAGHGVLLGRTVLIADELAEGRLVAPFDLAIESNFAYWFVCAPDRLEGPRVQAFRAWVRRQTEAACLTRPVSRVVPAEEAPGVVYNALTGRSGQGLP
jgi:LysR family glycine cleavage system transcriptional activator